VAANVLTGVGKSGVAGKLTNEPSTIGSPPLKLLFIAFFVLATVSNITRATHTCNDNK
jgi:hypothetical protein